MNYSNLFSKYYNLFYSAKDYNHEAEVIHHLIQDNLEVKDKSEIDLLELACGSGKHASFLSQKGYHITATDLSFSMIEQAKMNYHLLGNITFEVKDMTKLDYATESRDVVYSLFDALGYVLTNKAIDQVCEGVHSVLKPGGLFIFEVWHGAAFLRNYEPRRTKRWTQKGLEIIRHSKTILNLQNQIGTVEFEIIEKDGDSILDTYSETHQCRFFFPQEIQYILNANNFDVLTISPGFNIKSNDITDQDFHLLITAKKQS